jgi:L-asparagine transporter-like permease
VVSNVLSSLSLLVTVAIVLISMYAMDIRNWTSAPGFFPDGIHGVRPNSIILYRRMLKQKQNKK